MLGSDQGRDDEGRGEADGELAAAEEVRSWVCLRLHFGTRSQKGVGYSKPTKPLKRNFLVKDIFERN